jgi:hypothetical protein
MLFSSNAFRSVLVLAVACIASTSPTENVDLGTSGNYVILSKSGISTVPTSDITGDIAVSPIDSTAITGFDLTKGADGTYWTASQVTGKVFAANGAVSTPTILTTAVSDMETAYMDAKSRSAEIGKSEIGSPAGTLGGDGVGDQDDPLTAGVYTFTTDVTIGADLFFEGKEDDVFILRTTKNLMQVANTKVTLTGGALAKNVIWQVEGHVVVGANADMEGILLVKTDILFETGSSLLGRALAQTACNLQSTIMTGPPAGTPE